MLKAENPKDISRKSKNTIRLYISENDFKKDQYQTDLEVWEAFKNGSTTAFSVIYENYIDLLFRYGNKLIGQQEIIEDCLHNFFVDLWKKREVLGNVSNIKAYLLTGFRRRLLVEIKQNRKKLWAEEIDNFEMRLKGTIQIRILTEEEETRLHSALNALSAQKREAIYLRFFNNLSCSEIAKIMGIKTQSVYNLISSGLKALQRKITEFIGE
ncbi:MAG: RNA polymerase sigma factor [Cytophagales bacterium]|nr:RNA polymerase sigma factor [Cytophagales bacterium]